MNEFDGIIMTQCHTRVDNLLCPSLHFCVSSAYSLIMRIIGSYLRRHGSRTEVFGCVCWSRHGDNYLPLNGGEVQLRGLLS